MLYEKGNELRQLSVQHWVSSEVFSYQWFVILGVLIIAYAVWQKLADRRRGTELLLVGALEAVAKAVYFLIVSNELGLIFYTVRLLPITFNIFVTSVTVAPIIVMLTHQYTRSWKGYLLWSAAASRLRTLLFSRYMQRSELWSFTTAGTFFITSLECTLHRQVRGRYFCG